MRSKGFAIAGTVIGAVGSLLMLMIIAIYGAMLVALLGFGAWTLPTIQTQSTISQASETLQDYYDDNDAPPDQATADSLIANDIDAWGNPLRYEPGEDETFVIRSAGPDGTYDTADDEIRAGTYGVRFEDEYEDDEPAAEEEANGANEIGPQSETGDSDAESQDPPADSESF